MVAAVRNDPARRLELAGRFYDDRPGCASVRAYRRAELAFMRWQVSREAPAPPFAGQPVVALGQRKPAPRRVRGSEPAGGRVTGGPASGPAVARWWLTSCPLAFGQDLVPGP